MSFLIPKSPSLPPFPPSPSRGGRVLEDAWRTQGPATRLRSGRAPTILTDPRLARREPASDAGRPVTTAGALQDEARRGMGDVAFLHRRQQIRPEAQREIDEAKRNPGRTLVFRMEESRRWAILNDWPTRFNIEDSPKDDGGKPPHSRHKDYVTAASKYNKIIRQEGKKQGISPDLVRMIMYVENTHGALSGKVVEALWLADSMLPMNVKASIYNFFCGKTVSACGARVSVVLQDRS